MGLAWLNQQQLHRRSASTQRPDNLLVLLLAAAQGGDRECRQAQQGVAGGRFERADDQQLAAAAVRVWLAGDQLPVDVGQRLPEPDGTGVKIQVLPFQAAQLAGARAGRGGQDHEGAQPWPGVVLGGSQQQVDLLKGQQRLLINGEGRWLGVGGCVGGQAVPFHPVAECLVQAAVHLKDGTGVHAPWLAVLAATSCQLLVQVLDLEGPKRADRPLAKGGADVVFQQLAVAADGAQPDGAGVVEVGKPAVQQFIQRGTEGTGQGIGWGIGGRAVTALEESGIQRRSCGGPGPVAAQVVELAPTLGHAAFDAWVPAQAPG